METPFQMGSPKLAITLGGTEPYKYLSSKIPWKRTSQVLYLFVFWLCVISM